MVVESFSQNLKRMDSLRMNEKKIPWSIMTKYLGVQLDHYLNSNAQITETIYKAGKMRTPLNSILSKNPIPIKVKINMKFT